MVVLTIGPGDEMAPTHHQKHQAGRHLAVGRALLHGYDAELAGQRSTVTVNGRLAQVQVAAQGDWQISDVEKYLDATVAYVVLVDVRDPSAPGFFMAPGEVARELVRRRRDEFMAAHGDRRPRNPDSKHAKIDPHDVQSWKDRWDLFQ
jgi:hypothetical protein